MKKENNNTKKADNRLQKRETNRWMLVLYDSIVYVFCWLVVFSLCGSLGNTIPSIIAVFYLLAGYVLVFGLRFVFEVYKQIWRYGFIHAYIREAFSLVLGSGAVVLLGVALTYGLKVAEIPITILITFAILYFVFSIAIRVLYYFLFRVATKNTVLAEHLKRIIKVMAFVDFDSDVSGAVLRLTLNPDERALSPVNEIQNIAEKFAIRGDVKKIIQINKGYINRTYKIETLSDSGHIHTYTLQRINTNVFPDVDALMENFKTISNHLFGKFHLLEKDKRGAVQTIRSTKDGRSYLKDDSGCWRIVNYIDDVYSMDNTDNPDVLYQAGMAFGSLLKEMSDVDPNEIKIVIPDFHNTMKRYIALEESIVRDPKDRVKHVWPEIDFVRERKDKYGLISEALENGDIPLRVCHNDCNLNNILFDKKTDLPVAIIDLDTVMPSSPLYDFGDSMRVGTNTANDDERDLTKVSCDLEMYESYARGYLRACGDILTKKELGLLPYAAFIITMEDGIRFLMDHINGDTYYNIFYPGQNLDRARTQLKLAEDMEKKLPQIVEILIKIYNELELEADFDQMKKCR